MFGTFPHYDEALGPHNPNDLQHRHPFPLCWHKPQPFDVRLCRVPRKSIAQRSEDRTVRLVRLSTELTAIVLCNENGKNLIHLGTEPAQRRGMPTQSNNDGVIISPQKPYMDRLLKMYLQLGVIKEKWIPQIRKHVAEHGRAYIPEAEGVVRLKPVPFSIKHKLKDGKIITVYPVTEKPCATFIREGDSLPKGPWLMMPDPFFETHGHDGLPLDL